MRSTRVAPLLCLALSGCTMSSDHVGIPSAGAHEVGSTVPPPSAAGSSDALPPASALGLAPVQVRGQAEQGGWLKGVAPYGAVSVMFNGEAVALDPSDRTFFVGLDRDVEASAELAFLAADGQARSQTLAIARRDWPIERVDVALRPGGSDEEWWKRREPEWLAIRDARARETGAQGWRQAFMWPVTGRISGRFGRQRIYRGEPGSYHSGLDIAPGNGVPFVAPADGVVVLARTGFSLEGGIIIVDHGAGLNSAFIHLSSLAVAEGDVIKQGQQLGRVGASGRATGPHLHWSLMWRDKRLDPLLFLPPMP